MSINVREFDSKYDFEINGVSYVGAPVKNTAMYVTKKAERLLKEFEGAESCLVFVERSVEVPEKLREKNCFVHADNACLAYTRFLNKLTGQMEAEQRKRKFTLAEGGYYIGENVSLGENCYIEPNCLIGHDVVIGDNATVLAGTVIKNALIGDNFIAAENCTVGVGGFVLCEDENGNMLRIPTLGKVRIGDNVQLGAHDNIAMGTAGDTVIEDYVKIDALVYIGHDSHLHKNVELPAGATVGGYCELMEHSFAGFNATIRNRITIGKNSIVGMGAAVTKNVADDVAVVGNPARFFSWTCSCGRALKDDLVCPGCGRRYRTENNRLFLISD